jgi:hypothetical protein
MEPSRPECSKSPEPASSLVKHNKVFEGLLQEQTDGNTHDMKTTKYGEARPLLQPLKPDNPLQTDQAGNSKIC